MDTGYFRFGDGVFFGEASDRISPSEPRFLGGLVDCLVGGLEPLGLLPPLPVDPRATHATEDCEGGSHSNVSSKEM